MISDSTVYNNGKKVGVSLSWYENGYPKDSTSVNEDGSSVQISWFDNGIPASAGRFTADDKPIGKWQYFHRNGKLSSLETYNNGTLTDSAFFDETGRQTGAPDHKDSEAEFPGGLAKWIKYLEKNLYFPDQYKLVNSDQATVLVSFAVNEDGKVSEVFISSPFHPAFDRIAEEVVKRSPNWNPAFSHNRKIKSWMIQPVSFLQQ